MAAVPGRHAGGNPGPGAAIRRRWILRGTGRELPRDLQSILRQALAPDPARRYHHARELEADLDRFAAKQPVAARKHTLVYLTTTFLRRQARRSALAGALVLAGLAAAACSISGTGRWRSGTRRTCGMPTP